MTLSIEREILIDLLHNRGATPHQVTYRLRGESPVIVHRSLSRLVCSGLFSALRIENQKWKMLGFKDRRYIND